MGLDKTIFMLRRRRRKQHQHHVKNT